MTRQALKSKEMADVLILAPANHRAVYQDLEDLVAYENPVWAGMLTEGLQRYRKSVRLVDCQFEFSLQSLLDEENPRLIIIPAYGHQPSASTQTMHAVQELCKEIKAISTTPILLIGPHVSALPEESKKNTGADYVAKGEGLFTALNILGGSWKYTEEPAKFLDTVYPGYGFNQLPMEKYRAHGWHALGYESRDRYASIYTSLGCPFKCSFCMINVTFGGPSFRHWPPKFIAEKIRELVNVFGVQHLKWSDEMAVLKEEHFLGICKELIEMKVTPNAWIYARVDTVKDKYLETLKKAGINWLALGIESGSQYVRDGVTKGRFKVDDIYRTVGEIQRHGINVIGNYIFGLPDDTEESMAETLAMAVSLNTEFANFYSAMAYPGSPLYNLTPKESLPDSYLGYSQHSYETKPLRTKTVEAARVLQIRDEAHKAYFSGSSYLAMVERKFGQKGLQLIEQMNKKVLKRKLYDSN